MAVDPNIVINKSGVIVPVYNDDFKNVIGQLNQREAFALYGYEGDWYSISFLGPTGVFTAGMLKSPPDSTLIDCTNHPYGTIKIGNISYYTFIMRTTKNIYTATNNYWGQVAGGRRVACKTGLAGQNYQWYKAINYVEKTTGEWVAVTGDNVKYGFVDTGLRTGSSPTSIAMYGSW